MALGARTCLDQSVAFNIFKNNQAFSKRGAKNNYFAALFEKNIQPLYSMFHSSTAVHCCAYRYLRALSHTMNPLQDVDTNLETDAVPRKRKVSGLTVAQCSTTKRWRIRCLYHARAGAKGKRMQTGYTYPTKAAALDDAEDWATKLEAPRRKSMSPARGESMQEFSSCSPHHVRHDFAVCNCRKCTSINHTRSRSRLLEK